MTLVFPTPEIACREIYENNHGSSDICLISFRKSRDLVCGETLLPVVELEYLVSEYKFIFGLNLLSESGYIV